MEETGIRTNYRNLESVLLHLTLRPTPKDGFTREWASWEGCVRKGKKENTLIASKLLLKTPPTKGQYSVCAN